jgi:hypothetical protein
MSKNLDFDFGESPGVDEPPRRRPVTTGQAESTVNVWVGESRNARGFFSAPWRW